MLVKKGVNASEKEVMNDGEKLPPYGGER